MNNTHDENELSAPFSDMPARLHGQEQAEVTHYAYDPQTYEILCRPGQRLNEKKARRLQELKLYAYVVTLAEEHSS
ncbi:MAG TPA: hypothetical protein VFS61_03895 [Anaerolineales bacterium]|nr:hypothetical protein [Anaerolineales bacterium]